jgi:hypothetical protein
MLAYLLALLRMTQSYGRSNAICLRQGLAMCAYSNETMNICAPCNNQGAMGDFCTVQGAVLYGTRDISGSERLTWRVKHHAVSGLNNASNL